MRVFFQANNELQQIPAENEYKPIENIQGKLIDKTEGSYTRIGRMTTSCSRVSAIWSLACYVFFSLRDCLLGNICEVKTEHYYEKRWNEWKNAQKITSVYLQSSAITETQNIMNNQLNETERELLNLAREGIDKGNENYRVEIKKIDLKKLFEIRNRFEAIRDLPPYQWETIKDSPFAQEFTAVLTALRNETLKLSKETLAKMLTGDDPDNMMQVVINMAGLGVPSVEDLQQIFADAISILEEQKNKGESVNQKLELVIYYAVQLLMHKPSIKKLRDQTDEINFLTKVIQPLGQFAYKCGLRNTEEDLTKCYNQEFTVLTEEISPIYNKDAIKKFNVQLKNVTNCKLSLEEEGTLLNGITKDLRRQFACIRSKVDRGEFDRIKHQGLHNNGYLRELSKITDNLAYGITDMILDVDSKNKVARRLEFVAKLAIKLLKDNNFEALMAVVAALNSPSLFRIWGEAPLLAPVDSSIVEEMKKINKIISSKKRYNALRECENKAREKFENGEGNAPISFTGRTLTHLVQTNEQENYLSGKFNIQKLKTMDDEIEVCLKENKDLIDDAKLERETGFLTLISKTAPKNAKKALKNAETVTKKVDKRDNKAFAKSRRLCPLVKE
jgi:hypothetical protein